MSTQCNGHGRDKRLLRVHKFIGGENTVGQDGKSTVFLTSVFLEEIKRKRRYWWDVCLLCRTRARGSSVFWSTWCGRKWYCKLSTLLSEFFSLKKKKSSKYWPITEYFVWWGRRKFRPGPCTMLWRDSRYEPIAQSPLCSFVVKVLVLIVSNQQTVQITWHLESCQ